MRKITKILTVAMVVTLLGTIGTKAFASSSIDPPFESKGIVIQSTQIDPPFEGK